MKQKKKPRINSVVNTQVLKTTKKKTGVEKRNKKQSIIDEKQKLMK